MFIKLTEVFRNESDRTVYVLKEDILRIKEATGVFKKSEVIFRAGNNLEAAETPEEILKLIFDSQGEWR